MLVKVARIDSHYYHGNIHTYTIVCLRRSSVRMVLVSATFQLEVCASVGGKVLHKGNYRIEGVGVQVIDDCLVYIYQWDYP